MSLVDYPETYYDAFMSISPYSWATVGVALALGLSIIGAAWGILLTGSTLIGASVKAPRINSKNLISIIFCEAVAIYGVIIAIILIGKFKINEEATTISELNRQLKSGFNMFSVGLIVGISNLVCGFSCN